MGVAIKNIYDWQPYDYSKKDAQKFIANRILGNTSLGGIVNLNFPISQYTDYVINKDDMSAMGAEFNITNALKPYPYDYSGPGILYPIPTADKYYIGDYKNKWYSP